MRMPVYSHDRDYDDDAYGHRFGQTDYSRMPTSQHLGGYGDDAQLSFAPRPTAWPVAMHVVCDGSGVEITSTRLSTLIKPFLCISVTMVLPVYRLIFGCSPVSSGMKLHNFNRALTSLEGFRHWATRTPPSSLNASGFLNFVMRDGPEFQSMRQRMTSRLLPPGGPKSAVVLGPLLCYYLMSMACIRLEQMTGPVLDRIFHQITGLDITSLRVVTETGIRRMTANDLGEMVRNWAMDLCQYMARDSRMQESLDAATRCYNAYMRKCHDRGGAYPNLDPDGATAKGMLERNEEHSRMFLGIRATELTNLYKYLVCIMEGIDSSTVKYLRQVSESLQNLSG
ncbi:hypothetical protein IWW47_004292 [Coemansia sp. RSA 2052]|nr:hypothetical protein IWW47_004292 [Coemansia sp. RSA 2052]